MTEEQRPEIVQLNLSPGLRNANRDYYERYVNHIPDSIKLYLATTPAERLDKEAIDNEWLFAHRFGFDAPQGVREQIIMIKRQYGFTDREMRGLRHSGQMMVRSREARLEPDRRLPWLGWIEMIFISLMSMAMVFQVAYSSAPSWKQDLGMAAVSLVWFGMAWVINSLWIAPWRLLRRVGAG